MLRLRNAQGAYQLHATSRTESASTLRQQIETAPSGLRLLELPTNRVPPATREQAVGRLAGDALGNVCLAGYPAA